MILHIVNGDCALEGWNAVNFSGEVLVWRENYLLGVIPQTDDITLFNRIRAGELQKSAPGKNAGEIFEELQAMHRELFSLKRGDKLVLWLDCCPFDQALKKRLLELYSLMPEPPELCIVQKDVVWNSESFQKYRNWEDYH